MLLMKKTVLSLDLFFFKLQINFIGVPNVVYASLIYKGYRAYRCNIHEFIWEIIVGL